MEGVDEMGDVLESDPEQHKETVARESLDAFTAISTTAKGHLTAARSTSVQIADNSWTNPEADRNRRHIDEENAEGYRLLASEPAIARVTVVDEGGLSDTYYICRATPVALPGKGIKLASYRSAVGRLAALPVGTDHTLPRNGRSITVEVVDFARFQPKALNGEWDARNSIMAGAGYGPVTVESLRRLLERLGADIDEDLLAALLEEESGAKIVRDGLRRSVILKMDLRDQPILDQYQDDIFRLPLNSRLLLLGAPGTGKTTTLIRRLGQKLDTAFLDEDEQRAINLGASGRDLEYVRDWVMFTPTELLKLYVKEAFNREGIPAPDDRISTWSDYRENLARAEFTILRTASNSSSFVMKGSARTLLDGTETDSIAWFEAFESWQKKTYWDEMRASAKTISEHGAAEIARLGQRLVTAIGSEGAGTVQVFVSLLPVADEIRAMADERKAATDKELRKATNLQVNRDRSFLDALGSFMESLADVADDGDEQEDDEDDQNPVRVGRTAALNQYMRVMRTHARARARRRNVPKNTRTGRILDWLGDRLPSESELLSIGDSLLVQSSLRWFTNPVRRYVDGIPGRYRQFRRINQAESSWYEPEGFAPTDLHPLEVDVILLAMLRSSDELVQRARRLDSDGNPAQRVLNRMNSLYRTQVLVDEATDFSPIQLACMATLARPGTRSFFACGDFNQRVTIWGARTVSDIRWVLPDIETRSVSIAYRQSRHLHELARRLVSLEGDAASEVVLSSFAENNGVPPVLATGLDEVPATAAWLAARINEIEDFVEGLPSIAVLVNSEAEVRTLAQALGIALVDQNIPVIPCPDGQVRGRDGAVRVFNVEHIKGLEFEAVFFVGVDKLAENLPDLFDKYLYVGATRAATYFGMTSAGPLPPRLGTIKSLFASKW